MCWEVFTLKRKFEAHEIKLGRNDYFIGPRTHGHLNQYLMLSVPYAFGTPPQEQFCLNCPVQ